MPRFQYLRAFMLDPENMSTIEVAVEYEQAALKETSNGYIELPLMTLRQQYKGEVGAAFLKRIQETQEGKPHPQA